MTTAEHAALPRAGRGLAAALVVLTWGCVIVAGALGGAAGLGPEGSGFGFAGAGSTPSSLAQRDIPAPYLRLYVQAGRRYGLDWTILAAIGRVECDHGRDPDPSCTRAGWQNGAGAGGPMQFLASTWARYGVDGDGDGVADRWDPADAIYSAANYLRASGASAHTQAAIFAYNHARWYVDEVLRWARLYRRAGGVAPQAQTRTPDGESATSPTRVLLVPGERALLDPSDGHLAVVPAGVPPAVQAMVVAGNELQALPYGPGGHPDPLGASEEDCSSTVNYVLYRAGIRALAEITAENPLAQDYLRWGAPGPGRWVSILATLSPTPHVFMVIAGLRLDTSHHGSDVGPNRTQDGPRWRLLDHLPTWAHWTIRHPPGL